MGVKSSVWGKSHPLNGRIKETLNICDMHYKVLHWCSCIQRLKDTGFKEQRLSETQPERKDFPEKKEVQVEAK